MESEDTPTTRQVRPLPSSHGAIEAVTWVVEYLFDRADALSSHARVAQQMGLHAEFVRLKHESTALRHEAEVLQQMTEQAKLHGQGG